MHLKIFTKLLPVFLLIFISNVTFPQNHSWITPNRTYLKMYLAEDGLYRINKTDFTNAGISTSSIDPRTVKLYNKGIQVPIYFSGENDGVFNDSDYFDFYGKRNYGGPTITYNELNQVGYITDEYYNLYSDTSTYWIDWGGANGVRYSNSNYSASADYPIPYFFETLHFEKDKLYSLGANVSALAYYYLSTNRFLGEGWYWSALHNLQTVSDTFSVPLVYNQSQTTSSIKVAAFPGNRNTFIFNEHRIQIIVNGTVRDTLYTNDFRRIDTTVSIPTSLLSATGVNNITLKYIPVAGNESGFIYLDLFEVKYAKQFRFRNFLLNANLASADTTSKRFSVSGYNSGNASNIYDVSNFIKITNFTSNIDTLKFTAKSNARLEIANSTIIKKPFRIKQRQVPDLAAASNGADYLLLYHKNFELQAEQLRDYRATRDNFRSVKVEIEDIYDIFNFGQEDPVAVKKFVKHAYDNWQLPKIKYLCLFGRGSLDPKGNLSNSVYTNNYIPVFGNPPSDGYYSKFAEGSLVYNDQISTGRLPSYTPAEAQTMVNKIIAYENQSPAEWTKTFSFITGGGTFPEQQTHQFRSNYEINTYIIPPPVSGLAHKIFRNDDSGSTTYNYADSIKNDIDRGTLFVNFRGHAGSHDWEAGMRDPDVLNNGNKLPLVVSLTCFTGEHSLANFIGFGERFIKIPNKGAIGFIGTTGWSFGTYGNDFGTHMIITLRDSTRRLGDLTKYAALRMSPDTNIFEVRETINGYKLLGDPAAKLVFPKIPEFSISNNEYKLTNEFPFVSETSTLKIYPKNYGIKADSCKIRFQLKKNNVNYLYKDTVVKNFGYADSLKYSFKIDSSGSYKIVVYLDQDNWYPAENKNNNSITVNIPIQNNSFIPVNPVANSITYSDSIVFKALNPFIYFNQNNVKVMLQLDTASNFSSPVLKTFERSSLSGPVTEFKTLLPVLNDNTLYYFRTNSIVNNDTNGWIKPLTFIYKTINNNQQTDQYVYSHVNTSIHKYTSMQFSQEDFNNTEFSSDGISLQKYSAKLLVRSYGSNAEEASFFNIGNKTIFIDGGLNTGLNLVKVNKINGSVEEFLNLKMVSPGSSDTIVSFLNSFTPNNYLMLGNASYVPAGIGLTAAARTKLREFGSIYCDSIIQLGYFHTWSFIGFLGASASQVAEHYDPCCPNTVLNCGCSHWTESVSSLDVSFIKTSGSVSNILGPAKTWTDFSWEQILRPNSNLYFDVIGIDRNGLQTLLFTNLQTPKFNDLSSIDAYQYPKLNVIAKFELDSVAGTQSSVLNYFNSTFTPAAELILDKNSLQISSSSKNNGMVDFSFNYYNAGFVYITGVIVNAYTKSISDSNVIFTDTIFTVLKHDSVKSYSNHISTFDFVDSMKIYLQLKPLGNINEFYSYNNSVDFNAGSQNHASNSFVAVYNDGQILNNGDYVRKNPEIKISVSNFESTLGSDTSALGLMLNDKYIPYFVNGVVNSKIRSSASDKTVTDGKNEKSIYFYPELGDGRNKISVIYINNPDSRDTISYDVIVSDELIVKELYNYPNPMQNETDFILNLAGAEVPLSLKLRIYTVAGRLIKEIEYPATIGYNQIHWDGKDDDGEFVANGTYIYKLITSDDVKTESAVQKLVVLR